MKKEREFTGHVHQRPLTIRKRQQNSKSSDVNTVDKVLMLHLNQIKLLELTEQEHK